MTDPIDIEAARRRVDEAERLVVRQKDVIKELDRLEREFGIKMTSRERAIALLETYEDELASLRALLDRLAH